MEDPITGDELRIRPIGSCERLFPGIHAPVLALAMVGGARVLLALKKAGKLADSDLPSANCAKDVMAGVLTFS